MSRLIDYSRQYPDMPFEIIMYFSEYDKTVDGKAQPRNVFGFCQYYKDKFETGDIPQPRIVSKMCDILCDDNQLSSFRRGGLDGMQNSYSCSLRLGKSEILKSPVLHFLKKNYAYIVYGFKYIYEDFKQYILPVEFTDEKGEVSLGTAFLYKDGIVTAKHCIEGARKIRIKGISKSQLSNAKFEISENPCLDIIFIRTNQSILNTLNFSTQAEVLDEVMTLGFPKVAGYHDFLSVENAIVSSRYTATAGQIAANAKDIWMKRNLFLITAKIKGGNSGGPVVSKDGSIIGVSVQQTEGEGNYDNMGYGTVIPIDLVDEIMNEPKKSFLNVSQIEFEDFE